MEVKEDWEEPKWANHRQSMEGVVFGVILSGRNTALVARLRARNLTVHTHAQVVLHHVVPDRWQCKDYVRLFGSKAMTVRAASCTASHWSMLRHMCALKPQPPA